MTLKEVTDRVAAIYRMRGDDEAAHGAEDKLYADVLRSIADGTAKDPAALAVVALTTSEFDFARWCA